jgi:hypothetical protein
MATTREQIHEMLDRIPEYRLEQAINALEALTDDHIPVDDEEFTDEDLAAVAETRDELARGLTIAHDVVKRDLRR